jgi:GTPase SAR1 family protein
MISIYGQGFTEYERRNTYLRIIYSNVISSMKMLVSKSSKHGPPAANLSASVKLVEELKGDEEITPSMANAMAALWADSGIQATYANRAQYQLTDSTNYFLDKVKEIGAETYLPSEQDVLRSRVRTTGIVSNDFVIEGNRFSMFDVGGQRNERKKWIHCFENVTAVIFVAAISEYDQTLYEDETTNRMVEALNLFGDICNSRWFKKTSMILFLNKRDVFQEKIQKVPITVCFKEYDGPQEYDASSDYIRCQFEARNKATEFKTNDAKKIYWHITCATDKNNIATVFNAVKDIIIRESLRAAGLV